jgi:uncharacterized protein involved in propanediol utilization
VGSGVGATVAAATGIVFSGAAKSVADFGVVRRGCVSAGASDRVFMRLPLTTRVSLTFLAAGNDSRGTNDASYCTGLVGVKVVAKRGVTQYITTCNSIEVANAIPMADGWASRTSQ